MGVHEEDGRIVTNHSLLLRKEQALRLHAAGVPIMQVVAETGLSYPTVRKTLKLFQEAGKALALAGQRGRKTGTGRRISADQERGFCRQVVDCVPEDLGLAGKLWSRAALSALMTREIQPALSSRALEKYMKDWGFHVGTADLKHCMACPLPVRAWLENDYPQIHAQSRSYGGEVYWGSLRIWKARGNVVHREGKRMAPQGHFILSAISNRKQLRWLIVPAPLSSENLIRFMDGLVRDTHRRISLILESRLFPQDPKTQAWLSCQKERLELVVQPGCELRPPRCALRASL